MDSNYLRFIDCIHDTAIQNEELHDRPIKQQEETYLSYLYNNQVKWTSKDDK